MFDLEPSALGLSSSDPASSWISASWPVLAASAWPTDDPSMSTSSFVGCPDPSLSVAALGLDEEGTCTAWGNGEDGSGFCDDMEAWKEALVGVVASSIGLGWSRCELAVDLGVAGEAMSFLVASGFGEGKFTGRNAFAIVDDGGGRRDGVW